MKNTLPAPQSRVALSIVISAAAAILVSPSLTAQSAVSQLDPVVTSATRTPVTASQLGSAVDFVSGADLQRRQLNSLSGALDTIAGAPNFASGAPGAITSIFMRGAESDQTLFLVDGIRLNDPNAEYFGFLGGSCVSACDSLEVAHGPQSTLYGGEAMGGVVALSVQPGQGEPSGRIFLEAGSFGTVQGAVDAQGQRGATAYAFSLAGGHTDNDRDHNAFDSANLVARLDHTLASGLKIGATLRGFEGRYESPGTRFTNDPDNLEEESNWLATTFVEFNPSEDLTGRITLGGQLREFVSTNPGAFGTQITTVENERGVLDGQFTYDGWGNHRVTAGFTAEANQTTNDGFGDIHESQTLLALFVQDEITLAEHLWFTAGIRSDDHDTFGRATTGRGTLAWQVVPEKLKLRGSYGTAFRSPSFLDLYGQSAFYVGNPDLAPEDARGWDVGVDLYFLEDRGTASITYFDTDYDNLIVFDFGVSPSTVDNVEHARTHGVESNLRWIVGTGTELRASYTYLEAENQSQNIRLLRRPRHSGSIDVWHDFGNGWDAGIGLGFVADRQDVHASNFSTIDGENYTVARIYGSWQIRSDLKLRARVENAFDETYEEVHGYPVPGVGAYVGVEWSY